MEEFFKAIEDKIRAAGYQGPLDGEALYDESAMRLRIRKMAPIFLSKKDNGDIFEYKVDVMDEEFNLSYVHITAGDGVFHADFDQ